MRRNRIWGKAKWNSMASTVVYQFENKMFHLYLIEIYYKGDKEIEDINRIISFINEDSKGS